MKYEYCFGTCDVNKIGPAIMYEYLNRPEWDGWEYVERIGINWLFRRPDPKEQERLVNESLKRMQETCERIQADNPALMPLEEFKKKYGISDTGEMREWTEANESKKDDEKTPQMGTGPSWGPGFRSPLFSTEADLNAWICEQYKKMNPVEPTSGLPMPDDLKEEIETYLRLTGIPTSGFVYGWFPLTMVRHWIVRAQTAERILAVVKHSVGEKE